MAIRGGAARLNDHGRDERPFVGSRILRGTTARENAAANQHQPENTQGGRSGQWCPVHRRGIITDGANLSTTSCENQTVAPSGIDPTAPGSTFTSSASG